MNLLRTILTIQSLLAALCGLVGCDPNSLPDLTPPSAGVDVTPAKGGGGTIEPAEIPINVTVTVERRQKDGPPIIINERDEFAEDACVCGCGEAGCGCTDSLNQRTDRVKKTEKSFNSGAACQTWTQGGNLYWLADGVQWYLETGGTLGEGQAVQGGRFVMRHGQIIDTSGGRVQSVDTSKPRYIKQCDDTGCRLIRVN